MVFERLAVVVALPDELHALESHLDNREPCVGDGVRWTCGHLHGREVLLCRTGIGVERAHRRTLTLLRSVRVDAVLGIGFGGGLRDVLLNGDILVADEVIAAAVPLREGPKKAFSSDPTLLSLAPTGVDGPFVVRRGRLLTTDRILRTREEKRQAAQAESADVVDMESAGVARAAQEAGVPALFARVVVDDAEVDLPLDFSRIVDGDGRVRAAAFVGALVRRPWALCGLFDLRRRTNKALLSMTSFFCAFVESGHADEDSRQDQADR